MAKLVWKLYEVLYRFYGKISLKIYEVLYRFYGKISLKIYGENMINLITRMDSTEMVWR